MERWRSSVALAALALLGCGASATPPPEVPPSGTLQLEPGDAIERMGETCNLFRRQDCPPDAVCGAPEGEPVACPDPIASGARDRLYRGIDGLCYATGPTSAAEVVACPTPRSPDTGPTAPRTELTDDEMTRLRAAMPRLHAGMTQSEVLAALDVSLDGIGQLGTGPQHETTTVYVIGHGSQLDLTWDATDLEHVVLVRAQLLEPDLE